MYGSVVVELVCSLDTEVFGDCDDSLVPPLLSPRRCLVSDSVGVVGSVDVSLLGGATCCDVAADVVADADEDSERVGVDDEGADDDDVAALVDEAVDVAEEDEGVDAWLDAWVELVVGASVRRVCVGFDVGSDEVGAGVEASGAWVTAVVGGADSMVVGAGACGVWVRSGFGGAGTGASRVTTGACVCGAGAGCVTGGGAGTGAGFSAGACGCGAGMCRGGAGATGTDDAPSPPLEPESDGPDWLGVDGHAVTVGSQPWPGPGP